MKVKDIVYKIKIIGTPVDIIESNKVIKESNSKLLLNEKENEIMNRTLTCVDVENNKFIIWIKPLSE